MTSVLTIDMGTSVAKAGLWNDDGLQAVGRARLELSHPGPRRVEQDARRWWPAVVAACRALDQAGGSWCCAEADAVVLSGARQTFVPVTARGAPLGPALVWSDRRADAEALDLAQACGGAPTVRRRTAMVLDAASPPAKVAWLAAHEPERMHQSAWLVAPRDLVAWHLSGTWATDGPSASASGFYDTAGVAVAELVEAAGDRLPPARAPASVLGPVRPGAGRQIGLRAGVPVVAGAGDRACEAIGSGAGPQRPMVAWGTTANVSLPVPARPAEPPPGLVVTAGALGGWLVEGGVSAAGSLLDWLAALTARRVDDLLDLARPVAPGSGGLCVLPWPGGARAPWWRPDVDGAVMGLGFEHGPGHLTRAVLEAVAYDLARCLESLPGSSPALDGMAIGGSSATDRLWLDVLSGITGLGWQRRRSREAALAGAALVASAALELGWELEALDPVVDGAPPDPELADAYRRLRPRADEAARAALRLHRAGRGEERRCP